MRRKDREIKSLEGVFAVVDHCEICRLAMVDEGKPYMVALNFGYERQGDDLVLYFHSAMEGRKMDIWRKSPQVWFEMDTVNEYVEGTAENPCSYCWRFDSVMGSGKVEFITDPAEKKYALDKLIQHLDRSDKTFDYPEQRLSMTCVYKVVSHDITGKHHE
ncbi:MAG TPA: pyridoxamine 5'-phosphate oxidase [Peptococcaceae bacterium]|nr:pyridoxamine 5'-phosphate oxidase [Peptococcaceae bacterium]